MFLLRQSESSGNASQVHRACYQHQKIWTFDGWSWYYDEWDNPTGSTSAQANLPPPAPVISSLNPVSGPVGTPVEIHGSHFGATGTVATSGRIGVVTRGLEIGMRRST